MYLKSFTEACPDCLGANVAFLQPQPIKRPWLLPYLFSHRKTFAAASGNPTLVTSTQCRLNVNNMYVAMFALESTLTF